MSAPVSGENNAPNGEVRVQFDADNPAKTVDLATIQTMIQRWRKRSPAQFGYWLADALTDAEPSKTARPRA